MSHDTGAIRLRPSHDGRRFGIPDSAWSKLIGLLEDDPRITRIRVFGSRATGHFRQGSDIDLCIDADPLTLQEKLRLDQRIDDLLLPWQVDLAVWHMIGESTLKDHIERVGVTLTKGDQTECAP
jgi:predicted nucleotidyltransferase